MKQKLWLATGLVLLLSATSVLFAKPRERAKVLPLMAPPAAKAALDTIYFDNFESDTLVWTLEDFFVQDYTYWHIDPYNAYGGSGNSWWCGTDSATGGWNGSPGYADQWVQYLYSPAFDLSTITADTILFNFMHYYSFEGPSGGIDWDCANIWGSTDDGANWFIMYPDTARCGANKAYNLTASAAWAYMGLAPFATKIPGWGGADKTWKPVCFDLTPYKGNTLKIRYSFVSDGAESDSSGSPYNGAWFIDNISVDTLSAGGAAASIFYDNAEGGNIGWTAGVKVPRINWHKIANRTTSGTHAWYSGDTTTFLQYDGYSDALTSPFINLSEVKNTDPCVASFSAWVDMNRVSGTYIRDYDYIEVFVSDDSGATWDWVSQYVGPSTPQMAWNPIAVNLYTEINLSSYIGKIIQIRVEMNTDADQLDPHGEGLYLDDFIVTGKGRDALPSPSTILLVDNDGNAVDLAANSWTKYMESSLANLGYRYSLATIGGNKQMPPGYLEQFPTVIWNLGSNFDYRTGPGYRALTAVDQANIMAYLDNGGKLWMSGQYYFFANGTQLDTTVHPNLWIDYLHLAPENGWAANTTYWGYGVTGDPIGDGLADSLLYAPLNGGYPWTGPAKAYSLNPDTPAVNVAGITTNDDGSFNGLRYQDAGAGYKLVYTAFPFEAVSSQLNRDTLASRIIQWLLPGTPEYVPPAVPAGLTAVQQYDSVICTWNANSEPDLAGYNVYRALQVGLPVWVKIGTVTTNSFVDKSITAGAVYHYAVTAFDDKLPPNESVLSTWFYLHATSWKTGVEGEPVASTPRYFGLGQNNPNPFNRSTNIQFALPAQSRVRLAVYNITGQQVKTLVDDNLNSGYHNITWNGRDQNGQSVANGIYFYRMEASGANGQKFAQTKRLNLVK